MLARFPWMPSGYYVKNSLQLDLKMCMDSACRRVEGKPFHKNQFIMYRLHILPA